MRATRVAKGGACGTRAHEAHRTSDRRYRGCARPAARRDQRQLHPKAPAAADVRRSGRARRMGARPVRSKKEDDPRGCRLPLAPPGDGGRRGASSSMVRAAASPIAARHRPCNFRSRPEACWSRVRNGGALQMGRRAVQHSDTRDRARKTGTASGGSAEMKGVRPLDILEPDIVANEDWRPAIDWNVPCWRDQAEYPAPDALTPAGWAWEYLRRNPHYRADWQWRGSVTPGTYGLRQAIHPAVSPAQPEFVHAPRPPRMFIGPNARFRRCLPTRRRSYLISQNRSDHNSTRSKAIYPRGCRFDRCASDWISTHGTCASSMRKLPGLASPK